MERHSSKKPETAFEDVIQVRQEIDEAHKRLEELDPAAAEYADTLEVFGELQHRLEDLDAFRMKSRIEQVLIGLGFVESDFHRLTDEFSGGWQMRMEMAKLLLKEPSVLLLDEPTNHLDIKPIQWLEQKLSSYNKGRPSSCHMIGRSSTISQSRLGHSIQGDSKSIPGITRSMKKKKKSERSRS